MNLASGGEEHLPEATSRHDLETNEISEEIWVTDRNNSTASSFSIFAELSPTTPTNKWVESKTEFLKTKSKQLARRAISIQSILLLVFYISVTIGITSAAVLMVTNGQQVLDESTSTHLTELYYSTEHALESYLNNSVIILNHLVSSLQLFQRNETTNPSFRNQTSPSFRNQTIPFFTPWTDTEIWLTQLQTLNIIFPFPNYQYTFGGEAGQFVLLSQQIAIVKNDTSGTCHSYNSTTNGLYNYTGVIVCPVSDIRTDTWYRKTKKNNRDSWTVEDEEEVKSGYNVAHCS